jgi:hypothetical protein
MKEDAELGVLIPGRNLVFLERVPVGAEWPGLSSRIDPAEKRFARSVELVVGVLPHHIIRIGSLRRSGGEQTEKE